MPELPEVETVRRGLEMALKGAIIHKVTLRRKNLRIPFPADFETTLKNRKIDAITRRAKYLLFYLDKEDVLIAHLGMSGKFSVCHPAGWRGPAEGKNQTPQQVRGDSSKHDHVILDLKDGRRVIYNDARRFGLMTLAKCAELNTHPLLAELGPEPLEQDFSTAYLKKELARRTTAVKVALMDQKLVVGVGNIYASEALFLAGIDPKKPAKEAAGKASAIIAAIRKVLNDAIASGGSSLRDFVQVSGETGYFQHHFNVYGRALKPCFQCHKPIRSMGLSGRSTFYCAQCQK